MEKDFFYGEEIYGDEHYISEEYADEKWRHIRGVSGYMISNYGRIWSEHSNKFMKIKTIDDHGHLGVCLRVNGKPQCFYIHRLIADAFIPNKNRYPIVRHLNDDPSDNSYENLAWGTQKDNYDDSVRNGTSYSLTEEDREIGHAKQRKPVVAINLITGEKILFRGQSEAANILGLQQSNIFKVLRKIRDRTGDYYFEYYEEI